MAVPPKARVSLALLPGSSLALTLLGVYLAGVKGYDQEADVRAAPETPLFASWLIFLTSAAS